MRIVGISNLTVFCFTNSLPKQTLNRSTLKWCAISITYCQTQKEGDVFVVKAGASALPLTLKSAIIGSIVALIICGYAFALILGGSELMASTWLIVTIVSVVVGGLGGVLSALV